MEMSLMCIFCYHLDKFLLLRFPIPGHDGPLISTTQGRTVPRHILRKNKSSSSIFLLLLRWL